MAVSAPQLLFQVFWRSLPSLITSSWIGFHQLNRWCSTLES